MMVGKDVRRKNSLVLRTKTAQTDKYVHLIPEENRPHEINQIFISILKLNMLQSSGAVDAKLDFYQT